MATKIFPSVNDIYGGGGAGDGKNITENNFSRIMRLVTNDVDYIESGLNVPASWPDLLPPVLSGEALIQGYWVDRDAAEYVAVTASTTNYIYLKLTVDGSNNVTGADVEVNTTGTPPANSILLSIAVTDATTVTSARDMRPLNATSVTNQDMGNMVGFGTDGAKLPNGGSFDIKAVIGAAWESVGPTGSGATNIWPALNYLPKNAKGIWIRAKFSATASSGTVYQYLYARIKGSTTAANLSTEAGINNTDTLNRNDWQSIFIPLNDDNVFDLYYSTIGTFSFEALEINIVNWVQ